MNTAIVEIQQGEFIAHQPPAALAEQGRERRFAGAGGAGQHQRPAVPFDARGVDQEMAAMAECHLQVHRHFEREQAVAERHRHRLRDHVIAADRDRRPHPAAPRLRRLDAGGVLGEGRRRIAVVQPLQLGDRLAPGRAEPETDRPDGKAASHGSCAPHQPGLEQFGEPFVE